MGTFHTSCSIANIADRERSTDLANLLVDTGSEHTWVPEPVLESLGIEREKKNLAFVMANGQQVTRSTGFAIIRVGEWFTVDEVVFAEEGDLFLLGARSLEGMNLRVDSAHKKLVAAGPRPAASAQVRNSPTHLPAGPFEFSDDEWAEAKHEVRDILVERARQRSMICYSDLVERMETITLEAHDVRLFSLLGEISLDEHEHRRPLLSVLVVHKVGDMQPGEGFFELAKSVGKDTSDVLRCWVDEFKRVYSYWSGP